MKQYNDVVVGSGISGMTLALLLGLNGHSVLLLEKQTRIGGSMARFWRNGIPFDTGFHFTGGFHKNGILHDMLTVLGIRDQIKPLYITNDTDNRLVMESEQEVYEFPAGYAATIERIKEFFPSDTDAVARYFAMVESVCLRTVGMDLREISLSPPFLEEDHVSLDSVLKSLTDNPRLRGLLSAYSMCYGVKPAEVSFANHSRVSYGLYHSVARVEDGGNAFIRAFEERAAELDIQIMPSTYITQCADVRDRTVGRFVLNTGEELACDHCIFTIHPKEILKTLPREQLSKAFIDRVTGFEPSTGIFSLYGVVGRAESLGDGAAEEPFGPSILSLFPSSDVNQLMDPAHTGDQALVIIRNRERADGQLYNVVIACELSFVEHLQPWEDSRVGSRPAGYLAYKQQRAERIKSRILSVYGGYGDSFEVVDAASPLTFRDYLNSPDGSAYGVKQKVGQFNLFGKLPLRNTYAAGQSSLLPGLVGAMMSSFMVGRSIIGKDRYSRFLRERLGS